MIVIVNLSSENPPPVNGFAFPDKSHLSVGLYPEIRKSLRCVKVTVLLDNFSLAARYYGRYVS